MEAITGAYKATSTRALEAEAEVEVPLIGLYLDDKVLKFRHQGTKKKV